MTPAVIDPATWIDHSWLVTGTGVLFCIAGSTHTTSAVAGCAYYLRNDVATDLCERLELTPARPGRTLTYAGASYRKLPDLAPPTAWPQLHVGLRRHGITALPWSLLAAIDPSRAVAHLDPRAAARHAIRPPLHRHRCGQTVLHRLLTDLGHSADIGGGLGLTGSAALDPGRLCTAPDLDLLIFPNLDLAALTVARRSGCRRVRR